MEDATSKKSRRLSPAESGPYVLRHVLEDIPLATDEQPEGVVITSVELWNENLYVGTSASEILHLVALPAEDGDEYSKPTYILASRLQPSGHDKEEAGRGVQQILLLPGSMRACVHCNGVVSFYSLPEFSPAFPGREPAGISWIGGIDENEGRKSTDGNVVMIANAKRVLLVRVGEKLKQEKNKIEFPGCLKSCRRDTIVCIADEKGYALVDVEHQAKIPLFQISSTAQEPADEPPPQPTKESTALQTHGRSISMGGPSEVRRESPARSDSSHRHLRPPGSDRAASPLSPLSRSSLDLPDRGNSRPRSSTETLPSSIQREASPQKPVHHLVPHILSPFPSEFMVTTGATESEPGVGMFVNLDGDVVRGTVDFAVYPHALVVDDLKGDEDPGRSEDDQTVVALFRKVVNDHTEQGLEVQRVADNTGVRHLKTWLPFEIEPESPLGGLHCSLTSIRYAFTDVGHILQSIHLKIPLTANKYHDPSDDPRTKASMDQVEQEKALFDSPLDEISAESERQKTLEELAFAKRLGRANTRALAWSGKHLWQLLPNPLVLQLESRLAHVTSGDKALGELNASRMYALLAEIRNRDPTDETEFLGLNYIRQKTSLILFKHLQLLLDGKKDFEDLLRPVENALQESALDPRIVLLLLPPLANDVLAGPSGMWTHRGLVELLSEMPQGAAIFEELPLDFWMMIRHYLGVWQDKRGFGSITDEKHVFNTVDAALLHLLLHLDQTLPHGSGSQTSVRSKLHNVVDHWKGDFDTAVALLEQYRRLYILSRLYQSRKLSKDVLRTWRRILEGEPDLEYASNNQFIESQIRKYLAVISNVALVQEYVVLLAQRNPDLAIQFLTDNSSRVKFPPQDVTAMLKEQAPGAVQQYLEHLVFAKHMDQYSDDLIGYYLDSVLNVLESSEEARHTLAETYSTYRAMSSPKPTYLSFITDNPSPAPWWQARLRLLQLLGSGGYATASTASKELTYSVPMVIERLAPFSSYLVSESIILDARQGRHQEALKLLTHGLGDFDTAVRYCYFGGPAPISVTIDASFLPPKELQRDLFKHLFYEFLRIEDTEERLDRTSHLLGTFATWFDPLHVFEAIPQDWSVEVISEFLLRSFRAATSERNEAIIMKALSAAQNLQKQVDFIDVCEKLGPKFELSSAPTSTGDEATNVVDSIS